MPCGEDVQFVGSHLDQGPLKCGQHLFARFAIIYVDKTTDFDDAQTE